MSFGWILAVLFLQRMAELALCHRNRRALIARGGKEFYPETYPIACLAGLVAVTTLRYASIATLGERWTTRIVSLPGSKVVRAGPYRFFRHPNYLVIALEFLLFPLLLRAPFTLVAFSLANLPVLRQRIRLEEKVLRETTDYGEKFS
jgi:methyltransferase